MNPDADAYFRALEKWKPELTALRAIVLECQLQEEWKWRSPCYTYNNSNVIILGAFKDHCVISFLKGVLLQDSEDVLLKPGENSQSVRFIKFTEVKKVEAMKRLLKAYIYEAIEVEKAGLKVDLDQSKNLTYVDELLAEFKEDVVFSKAFEKLTPGRKRAYNMFFSAAKHAKTRKDRIAKYRSRIMDGKGLNDCVCGLSKRYPACDGSHKNIE